MDPNPFFSAKKVMFLPVCWLVGWVIGWLVSRMTQKLLNRFLTSSDGGLVLAHNRHHF